MCWLKSIAASINIFDLDWLSWRKSLEKMRLIMDKLHILCISVLLTAHPAMAAMTGGGGGSYSSSTNSSSSSTSSSSSSSSSSSNSSGSSNSSSNSASSDNTSVSSSANSSYSSSQSSSYSTKKKKKKSVFDPFDHVYGLIRLKNLLKPTNHWNMSMHRPHLNRLIN